jgi:CO dehydrogenase maturation factor
MKIAICGKGGSGKSSLTTLLAMALRDRGLKPLVVDCDESNSGLYRMLGLQQAPLPIMEIVGGKKGIKERLAPKYAPGSKKGTNVLERDYILIEQIPEANLAVNEGIRLVSIGKIVNSMEGCACPFGMLGREFLAKLKLSSEDVVLVDMEAGIEHFGRGVETSVDTVIATVEPSMESITLASKIRQLSQTTGVNRFAAVLTKINSEIVESTLKDELKKAGVPVIGAIPYDDMVFEACLKGQRLSGNKALEAAAKIANAILNL